jgi:hypothetical protein
MALSLLTKRVAKAPRSAGARGKADDLYETSNLFPEDTGLPVTVWVSRAARPGMRRESRHAARIKVCRIPGNRMVPSNTALVGIEPEPRLIEGRLSDRYLDSAVQWIELNRAALLACWNGEIGSGALIHRLQRAPA